MEYIKGRTNLSATIFVPYDYKNNCPFCTSKKDYKDCSNFSLEKIRQNILKLNNNPYIQEYVITGGEPFADIQGLYKILEVCDKNVYINTTLPNDTFEEAVKIINSEDKIKGINVSRHIGFDFKNVASIEDLDKIHKSIRINTVINKNFNFADFLIFVNKYGKKKRDINLRADYRSMTLETLKARDDIFYKLAAIYNYVGTESCMVCNTDYFSVNNNFLVSYHRGLELSSVVIEDKCYVNDILLKQTGELYKDWNCERDVDFVKWALNEKSKSTKIPFDINNLLSNIGRPVWYVFKCGTTITIKQDKIAEIDITNNQIIFKLNDSEYYIIYDYSGNVVENYWRVYFEYATALKNAQKLCLDK